MFYVFKNIIINNNESFNFNKLEYPKKCPKQHYEFEVVCVGIENSEVLKKIKQIQMCSNILHTQTKRSIDLTCV